MPKTILGIVALIKQKAEFQLFLHEMITVTQPQAQNTNNTFIFPRPPPFHQMDTETTTLAMSIPWLDKKKKSVMMIIIGKARHYQG